MSFDAITEDDLRQVGSVKWTRFPDTIGMFIAEMDFGVAPAITGAVCDAMTEGFTGYLSQPTAEALKAATVRWHAEHYGWDVPVDDVRLVADVLVAYEFAITTYTSPGAAVIVPTPAYMPFLSVPLRHGRRVIEVPSVEVDGRWTMDLDAVAQAFDDGGELLVLCNPHNPLGTVATRDELLAIAKTVSDAGGHVFSDEIHAPLVYAPAQHIPYASVSDASAEHTITATSASKAWNLAGFKCAQLILSNDASRAAWDADGGWAGHGTATIGVIAQLAAYTAGEEWLQEVTDYLDGNRRELAALVAEHLPGVRVTMPEGTYIALLDFRETGLTGDLGEWFREHAGVSMTDGAACGEAGIGYTRFVFATPRPIMREAVVRIAKALESRAAA
ncbi:aminotransferase class I/II-fold pyridoxal phosphate-dependent enzyme [Microbacterium esteraromaticum]|uniref:MalY/PatB family protein n=1 Tax=Microbacterium esteraromaticum TaxID=57043 RepID=UPI001CD3F799|nr:aminotransferase class I/II-fold pyridoxal phosphate-dependent enzyme [Microbacterium esteraromaticum]MCA1306804.1 aminotransferase class I/II-fold pyridoxal phosphate-dependent enzyme [Microbacterium esteraromaticum]